jgi:hypothetical protein
MIIYRGIKNILYKNIDPLFRNSDDFLLDYGAGTSYAYEKNLAEEYCQFGRSLKFSWLLTYEFLHKNPLYLNSSHTIDDDGFEFGVFIEGQVIARKNLAQYAAIKGHDCIIFEYDEMDPHVMLLSNCLTAQLELTQAEIFSETQEVVTALKKKKYHFDGQYFVIPLADLNLVDSLVSEFLS